MMDEELISLSLGKEVRLDGTRRDLLKQRLVLPFVNAQIVYVSDRLQVS
jgi:hypothetical protein